MGSFDSASVLKIVLPIIFLLFPTALFLFTTSSNPSYPPTSDSADKPAALLRQPLADKDQASRALLVPETNRSSSSSKVEELAVRLPVGPVEEGLARARASIRRSSSLSDDHLLLHGEKLLPRVYRNPSAFYRSYLEMEKRLKIYVYEEGESPLVHDGPCKNIYAIEGRFIQELEAMGGGFRTRDPTKANLFFLPFSITWMVKYVYESGNPSRDQILRFVADYVGVVASKHPYWNRTAGADHFMLSCHDWGPLATTANHDLYNNSIRAFCNANTTEGFRPRKDISIPEINLLNGDIPQQVITPPSPATHRPYLAFFAGGLHGPIRPVLLDHWGSGRDPALQVHQYLPSDKNYFTDFMLKSKFCLCPSGYEVASPRIPEAIYAECVPVLISQGYYPPFSDVLRWEEFSVTVEVEDIPRLKEILSGIKEEEIERLREGVRGVRRHFLLNRPAKRFDVFHMILHSVWLRRLNLRTAGLSS